MGKNLTRKILESHLAKPSAMNPGDEIYVKVDQTLTHDINAVMTYLCVSRSEITLFLGVSRYVTVSEALADEPMGDLLYFDLDVSIKHIRYNVAKSAKGIAGIPVDVEIKYQTYWRNGYLQDGVTLIDNI